MVREYIYIFLHFIYYDVSVKSISNCPQSTIQSIHCLIWRDFFLIVLNWLEYANKVRYYNGHVLSKIWNDIST